MGAWEEVKNLFGIRHYDETDSYAIKHRNAWLERRKRLLARRCGRLTCEKEGETSTNLSNDISDFQRGDQPNQVDRMSRDLKKPKSGQQKSRQKRSDYPKEISESRINVTSKIDNNIGDVFVDDGNDIKKEEITLENIHSPISASYIAQITHAPILRTTSDTAIQTTTARPHHQKLKTHDFKHLDEDKVSHGSFDFTDFDAKESINKLVNDVLARHQPRRAFGMGLVGKLLSRKFRKDLTCAQKDAIYSFNDHRPYFTYWVTTVQILIMIITLITYGFGPFDLTKELVNGPVYVASRTWVHEAYYEQGNIWFGPRSSDLIHLGAKFTPCMRRDSLIYKEIDIDRQEEGKTGCCDRKDRSGCLQTTKEACSSSSIWHSWNDTTSVAYLSTDSSLHPHKRRFSGPVCGQDPMYCLTPASTHPHEWPDDITQWPICREHSIAPEASRHMSCEVVGRPCCIGIYGQCRITSSHHCQFLRGTFHREARLCSQVSCMEDVCGMIPFYARDYPDQFYRLFTALLLHAGLIHLTLTVILQYYIMRDIERLLGSTRMAIIYILPGVAGNIASATFVPYHTQVGPSGSQFALLACLMAETINSWNLLEDAPKSLRKLVSIAIGLFILGLLPWIDNYAHIFGFFVGLMLSLALTPYLTPFNDAYNRRKKVIQIWVCIVLVIITFVLLPLPLYIYPLYKCSWCQYLDCWPLAPNWCENQDIKVTRLDIF